MSNDHMPTDAPSLEPHLKPEDVAAQLRLAEGQRRTDDRPGPSRIYASVGDGLDSGNAPPVDELVRHEQSARQRLNPRRLLGRGTGWTELRAIDERIAELDQRLADVTTGLQALRTELGAVDREDAARVAEWIAGGEQGDRPLSRRPELETAVRECENEHEATRRVIESLEQERAATVERHRGQMVADALRMVTARKDAALWVLDEARRAREVLVEAADLARWAARFPEAVPSPPWDKLALDSKAAHEGIGAIASVDVARLIDALTADIEMLVTAAGSVPDGDARARARGDARWASERQPDPERQRITEAVLALARTEFEVAHPTEQHVDAVLRAIDAGELPDPR